MKLLPEWRAVLVRAWSARLIAIAVLLDGLSTAFPYLQDTLGVPSGTFGALSGLVSAIALFARIVVQDNVPDKTTPAQPLALDTPDEVKP